MPVIFQFFELAPKLYAALTRFSLSHNEERFNLGQLRIELVEEF